MRNTFDVFVVQLFISRCEEGRSPQRPNPKSIDAEKLPCQRSLFLLGFNPSFWCLRAWSSKLITELETERNFHFLSVRHSLMLQCYMYVYTSNRYTTGNHKVMSSTPTVFGLTNSVLQYERYIREKATECGGVRDIIHNVQLRAWSPIKLWWSNSSVYLTYGVLPSYRRKGGGEAGMLPMDILKEPLVCFFRLI